MTDLFSVEDIFYLSTYFDYHLNILQHSSTYFQMFLTIHSYGQYILHPWGYAETDIADSPELQKMGQIGAKAIQRVNGRRYKVGSAAKMLYPASGK